MSNNDDTDCETEIGKKKVVGIGSFHKTLPHNDYGEVDETAFKIFVKATRATAVTANFQNVPKGDCSKMSSQTLCINPATKKEYKPAAFVNPQAGLAKDRLTNEPCTYKMPNAPRVLCDTTAAEMTELYWMSLLRDVPFDQFDSNSDVKTAADEINEQFKKVAGVSKDGQLLQPGIDVPDEDGNMKEITPQNIFRLGLPGEKCGPLISQFFIRPINYGSQHIDQRVRPYKTGRNYLTIYEDWLRAQELGVGIDGNAYGLSNEAVAGNFETNDRYISTMRDMARFVNKDALHQAYFNAAILLLDGGARWTQGNPYGDCGSLEKREAGFGTLGGPHILALVSEAATRALKIVWYQKWQVHLRLRPEAYGGLVHLQNIGINKTKRPYGLPNWVAKTEAAKRVRKLNKCHGEENLLLPMAFSAGSPAHPAYGAGHAAVAGICVTVLKAFFKTFEYGEKDKYKDIVPTKLICRDKDLDIPCPNNAEQTKKKVGCITERLNPNLPPDKFIAYETGVDSNGNGYRTEVDSEHLTIEGELNKLAMNVAMGRSMGGVHWRTDNARSLSLGEAVAARVLADITKDLHEKPKFEFRTFSRKLDGEPKIIEIENGKVMVDGSVVDTNSSAL